MTLPRKTRIKIFDFVASHDDCRVIFGPTWRAWSVLVVGYEHSTSRQMLLGRPRTEAAADLLHSTASQMVAALEKAKPPKRHERNNRDT